MAITISGSPQTFTPVYNPIFYYLDSTNKTEDGFKYLVDIYSANTANLLATYSLFPRPIDGLGVADINQVLQSSVSAFFNSDLNQFSACPENFINYDVCFGEEYLYSWPYTSAEVRRLGGASEAYAITLSGLTNPLFDAGDQIIVVPDNPSNIPNLFGRFGVSSSGTSRLEYIDTEAYGLTGTTIYSYSGTVSFQDGRKSQFPSLTCSTGNTTYNGAVTHKLFKDYLGSVYNIGSFAKSLLFSSRLPANRTPLSVKTDNRMWVNFYSSSASTFTPRLLVTTYNGDPFNGGVVNGQFRFTGSTAGNTTMQTVAIGPYNLNNYSTSAQVISGALPIIDSAVTHYVINLQNSGGTDTTLSYVFKMNTECFRYDNIELYFFDRMGAIIPVNFELQSTRKISVSKSEYQSFLGDLNTTTNRWGYNAKDRGRNQINTTVIEEMTLNTNWLTEQEASYFQELYTSPLVYMREGTNFWPVITKTNDLSIPKKNNKKNFQYTITIEMANQDVINKF
jgi:hypothetical protein